MNAERRKPLRAAFRDWWGQSLGGDPRWDNGAARKARAELRRAANPAEALCVAATHDLRHRLADAGDKRDWRLRDGPQRLALVAATLAAVEAQAPATLPALFGRPEGEGERRALSHLRFQRIVRETDPWRLAVLLRRALPLAGHAANVGRLGEDLLFWGDDVRSRWCFDYFGSVPPDTLDPDADTETTPESEDA